MKHFIAKIDIFVYNITYMSFKNYLEKRAKTKFKKKYKVGLCLSGGGTRGFSFLGAFKAFQECGIEFDAVADLFSAEGEEYDIEK